jgi:RNA polymerase sigma factor (sigma-70 family)
MRKIRNWNSYFYFKEKKIYTSLFDVFLLEQLKINREKALDEIIKNNISTAHHYVLKYVWSNISYDDLLGYAILGIISAADNFDTSKNVKFSTYCTHYIIGRIKRALEQHNNIIRIPAHINLASLKISHLDLEEEISDTTLNELTDDRYKINHLRQAIEVKKQKIVSIQESLHLECESTDIDLKIILENALNKLSDTCNKAMCLKFGINENRQHSYAEIDKLLNINSEVVILAGLKELQKILGGKIE